MPPYTYVYSPITLPLLRAVGHLPFGVSGSIYWTMYVCGMFAILWACLQAAEPRERRILILLAPITPFFPGLLQTNVILSGNLAYILYGLALSTAVLGWRKSRWLSFYAAVLVASCFKVPLLSLLAIPLFSAKHQLKPAVITAVSGLALFAIQPLLWPALFRSYLNAVGLQFTFNSDFGFSPAGILSTVLNHFHQPYSSASTLLYGVYAAAVAATLAHLAKRYFRGDFPIERWIPVLLLGVILLNPRIKEYDIAPLTLPLGLVAWRLFAFCNTPARAALEMGLFLFCLNSFASNSSGFWRPTAGAVLTGLFIAGTWQLLQDKRRNLAPFLLTPKALPTL